MTSGSKLYTCTGDDGTTGLRGNFRVGKEDPRIDLCGTVDELNALLGVVRTMAEGDKAASISEKVAHLQNEMFSIGSELATPPQTDPAGINRIDAGHVRRLEEWIDEFSAVTPPLHSFILPGGTELNAYLHLARTACRRAERRLVRFSRHDQVSRDIMVYFNRLSDLLFIMARYASHIRGAAEYQWQK